MLRSRYTATGGCSTFTCKKCHATLCTYGCSSLTTIAPLSHNRAGPKRRRTKRLRGLTGMWMPHRPTPYLTRGSVKMGSAILWIFVPFSIWGSTNFGAILFYSGPRPTKLGLCQWGVAKGSSISWVAKLKEMKTWNGICQMGGRAKSQGDKTASFFTHHYEYGWSRSYRVTNQHPDLPWNFVTHGLLDPSAVPETSRRSVTNVG